MVIFFLFKKKKGFTVEASSAILKTCIPASYYVVTIKGHTCILIALQWTL